MGSKVFVPSLLEAPNTVPIEEKRGKRRQKESAVVRPNYSIDTVRRLKHSLKKSDRLFFLIGVDAFDEIAKWREAEALFHACEFIVASRPGYSLADLANALPPRLRPSEAVTKPFAKQPAKGDLALNGVTVHLLDNVHQRVSATAIRKAIAEKRSLKKFVDPQVEEYIKKMGLDKS